MIRPKASITLSLFASFHAVDSTINDNDWIRTADHCSLPTAPTTVPQPLEVSQSSFVTMDAQCDQIMPFCIGHSVHTDAF